MEAPADPIQLDPTVARVRAMIAALDAELLEGVGDVDRTLIDDPWQRMRRSFAQHDTLQEMARCLRSSSTR
jgi:hypothetical protein